MKQAALYVRVSTDRQTVENQIVAPSGLSFWRDVAPHSGLNVSRSSRDLGVSGCRR